MQYIHNHDNWWQFRYDSDRIVNVLGRVRAKQGVIIGRMLSLGFDSQDRAVLTNMSTELMRSSEIEGENLNLEEVRSSIARRLGITTAGIVHVSRYVEGVVEMQIDATQNYDKPLSSERLFGWHNVLFPTGMSGLYHIDVGKYRSGDMQVVSGAMGMEKVHYQAPSADRVPEEMERFISWVNGDTGIDAVLKAAIAHLWFVSIHPFDDGNGRIARALTDMLLARSENCNKRFYSISAEMKLLQKNITRFWNARSMATETSPSGFYGLCTVLNRRWTPPKTPCLLSYVKPIFGSATETYLSTRDSESCSICNSTDFWANSLRANGQRLQNVLQTRHSMTFATL